MMRVRTEADELPPEVLEHMRLEQLAYDTLPQRVRECIAICQIPVSSYRLAELLRAELITEEMIIDELRKRMGVTSAGQPRH